MRNKYYYLVSSLPYLKFAHAGLIGIKVFLLECGKWLHEKDMQQLAAASINDFFVKADDAPVVKAWKNFDSDLRKELAAARENIKYNHHDKPGPLAKIILEEAHPLLMEQAFERVRWNYLDQLEAGNFFDLNFLIVYFLKLQIIERLAMFDQKNGKEAFESMCEAGYV